MNDLENAKLERLLETVQKPARYIGGEMNSEEIAQWISIPGVEEPVPMPSARPKFNVGDQVEIVDGPFQGSKGVIQEVDTEHGFLRVETMVFNRANSIELEPSQVEKFVE